MADIETGRRYALSLTQSLILAVLTGLAAAFAILGWTVIDPTNQGWLEGDRATGMIGWAFYRESPGLALPLTWAPDLGHPVGTPIAMLDAIPMVAIPLRALSDLLPEPFQYLGLFAVLSLTLQAFVAIRLGNAMSMPLPLTVLMTGFLVLSPVLLNRLMGHYTLTAHWLVLWALLLLVQRLRYRITSRRAELLVVAISLVAATVHPYFVLMVWIVGIGVLLLDILDGGRFRRAVIVSLLNLGLCLVTLHVVGFLDAGLSSAAGGYGIYSLNLLAPFNPAFYGSPVIPDLPVISRGQAFEGYAYLGAGMLALTVIAVSVRAAARVTARPKGSPAGAGRRVWLPTATIFLCSAGIAMTHRVTLGDHTVFSFDIPGEIENLVGIFRASGRLFWPGYYLIVIGVFACLMRLRRDAAIVVTGLALALQVIDLSPLFGRVSAMAQTAYRPPDWTSDLVQALNGRDHLVVLPAWQCNHGESPGGIGNFAPLGWAALGAGTTINSYYAARYPERSLDVHCLEIPARFVDGRWNADTLYFVSGSLVERLPPEMSTRLCRPLGPGFACGLSQ